MFGSHDLLHIWIIGSLRQRGHVVGFMGDGINDAAALKAADVGISVDSAVDIAKRHWPLVGLMLVGYIALAQVVKTWFVRRYEAH